MAAGGIARWHVKEGQAVGPGDVLADIETDKATLAFENQEDGFIAKILVAEGTRDVPVGQPVAVMVEDEAAVAAFRDFSADAAAPPTSSSSSSSSPPSSSPSATPSTSANLPPHVELAMPALSPTMDSGAIAAWHVKEGQAVSAGDVVADIETDKATLGFEVQDDGIVARILLPAGTRDIRVGTPVAIIVDDAALVPAFAGVQAGGGGGGGAAVAAAPPSSSSSSSSPSASHNARLGPAARFALHEAGLSVSDVPAATGPNGIVTKADVLAAVAAGVRPGGSGRKAAAPAAAAAAPAAATAKAPAAAAKAPTPPPKAPSSSSSTSTSGTHTDVPNSQVRRVIASRLLESKRTLPASYSSRDVDVSAVAALRRELAASGVKVSLNDCVVRAAALALRAAPQANAQWDEASGTVKRHGDVVDVAVAVATEGGLLTPIVRGADAKSLREVASEVRELASRARAGTLKPEEFSGGTFTISNLGMFGLDSFSAIINPPQGAILAVGGAREEAALVAGGALEARSVMTATLSCDERAVGPEAAAAFLEAFAGFLARPATLLM